MKTFRTSKSKHNQLTCRNSKNWSSINSLRTSRSLSLKWLLILLCQRCFAIMRVAHVGDVITIWESLRKDSTRKWTSLASWREWRVLTIFWRTLLTNRTWTLPNSIRIMSSPIQTVMKSQMEKVLCRRLESIKLKLKWEHSGRIKILREPTSLNKLVKQ